VTLGQAGIRGTHGHPTWVTCFGSGFDSDSFLILCSFLAQLLWFAAFVSFALGLGGY
jgi:hypothetical protein